MTSKLVVNTIEADTGISSVSFASSISLSSTSVFHLGDAGLNIGADTNISRAGNGILAFNINGSEKVRIESGGGLKFTGQGTSIPVGGILHHTNNNLYVRGGTSGLILGNQDNTTTVQIYNNFIRFETDDGTEKLRIGNAGQIGLSGENYGSSMYVVNVHFKEEYVVWRKREEGGGLVGNFPTRKEAEQYLEDNSLEMEKHDITQTQIHTLLRLDDKTSEISDIPFLFDCASSKLKVSREWNTKIMKQGGDRFSYLWKMSSVPQSNAKGSWVNIDIGGVDWLKDEIYEQVKAFYSKTFA